VSSDEQQTTTEQLMLGHTSYHLKARAPRPLKMSRGAYLHAARRAERTSEGFLERGDLKHADDFAARAERLREQAELLGEEGFA
jgi:hypothetical protein